jgi:hypothetical protein
VDIALLFVCGFALLASILTFFSGFGLGTILTPVMALFFPIEIAVSLTAVVHFMNNLFKISLVGRHVNFSLLLKFGIPAIPFAFLGSWLLTIMSRMEPLLSYSFLNLMNTITPVELLIGILLMAFSAIDLTKFRKSDLLKGHIGIGGMLSGFFGGLSGHQGALRSAVLIHTGLDKKAFMGTGVAIAMIIDVVRITNYSTRMMDSIMDQIPLLIPACISAIIGAYLGFRLLEKVTIAFIQKVVAVCLLLLSFALIIGLL